MFSIKKVDTLPAILEPETLYYVKKAQDGKRIVLTNFKAEIISDCLATKFLEDMDTSIFFENKVDKVEGQDLSDHDFLDFLRWKLETFNTTFTTNSPDAFLLDRANHTGTQDISTVVGLEDLLKTKAVNHISGRIASNDDELHELLNEIPTQTVIFNEWLKISNGLNDKFPSSVAETKAWRYVASTQSYSNTTNSNTLIGAISPKSYPEYRSLTHLRSTHETDDDIIGIVIAFHKDPVTGREYTLTAVRTPGGMDQLYQIVYNYRQLTQKTIVNGNSKVTWGNGASGGKTRSQARYVKTYNSDKNYLGRWRDVASRNGSKVQGALLQVIRKDDIIEVQTTQWKDTSKVDPSTLLTLDLNSDPLLDVFKGSSPYGFCGYSQENSFWDVRMFVTSVDTIYDLKNKKIYDYTDEGWAISETKKYSDIVNNTMLGDPRTGRVFMKFNDNLAVELETTVIKGI